MSPTRQDKLTHGPLSWIAVAGTLLILDLLWLGVVAADFYRLHMGALLKPQVSASAALVFYMFYTSLIWDFAVRRTESSGQAWRQGAYLGFVSYGVYELTNWAVITDWPVILVPVDWMWGIVLTGLSALAGSRFREVET